MTTYAPTANPGDTRRRTRYIGIRTSLNDAPQIDVLEQEIILTAGGEKVLEDLGRLPVGAFNPAEEFAILNPGTDAPLGGTATVAEAMTLIYSWVRHKQAQRDANA